MTAELDQLAIAKGIVRTELLRGRKGRRAEDRVEQILDDYQHALKRAHAQKLTTMLREQHSAVYDDAGQHTAAGLLRAVELIEQATP